MKSLFLIDASSFVFRAFFAIPRLSTSKGLPTNATYGFTNMLLKVVEEYKPDYVACVFDTKEPTFREKLYVDYKANRGAPPDELIPQFEHIHRAVEAMGLVTLKEPGFEADDIIGTLVEKFRDCKVTIVSSDKDLMQLVNDRVHMLDTMKEIEYGVDEVKKKLGIEPKFVTDYLGLIGDASDNIPGVPSIGPKTAVDLIETYGSLEQIIKNIPTMKEGKRKQVLAENSEIALLSKKLATVDRHMKDGATRIELDELKAPHEIPKSFKDFVVEMEFHTLAKKYGLPQAKSVEAIEVAAGSSLQVKLIKNEKEWKQALEKLSRRPHIAFDTETRGKRVTDLEMVGMSLCADGCESFYVPVRHQGDGTSGQIAVGKLLEDFKTLVQDKLVIAQNLKYDYKVLLVEGLQLEGPRGPRFYDTMLAHYLIEPEEKHGLDFLAGRYLNAEVGDFEQVLDGKPDFSHVPLEKAARYGALDSWATCNLYDKLTPELKKLGLEKLFYEIEMPVAPILAQMEFDGIEVDPEILNSLSDEYSAELHAIEKEIFDFIGFAFNLNSPKQLSEVLFSKLNLPIISKTKTGISTDVSVLEKLAPLHPVPALIVRYRELTKLKSTYVDVLPTLVEKDGRVHANFNQAITATGRLSSSNPNLQNIPVKTETGRKIRKAFIAKKGCALIGADYSQIELRLCAHLSQDQALLNAFLNGGDVHRSTAAEIFHVKPEEVTSRQREAAKAINFGLIYGKTAFGLSHELNISRVEASAYIQAYFERYRGVKQFMDQCLERARKNRVTSTMFGRIRPIRDIDSKNFAIRNNAERIALNAPLQGTAADIMKLAMIGVFKECHKLDAKIVLQVHDELVLEIPKKRVDEGISLLREKMEKAVELSVPLTVNCSQASNWMDL